jgi:hypothetical protein
VLLRSSLVLVTWAQLLVGGAGIALVGVGIVSAVALVPHIDRRCDPPAAIAYVCLLFGGAAAAGACLLVAGGTTGARTMARALTPG